MKHNFKWKCDKYYSWEITLKTFEHDFGENITDEQAIKIIKDCYGHRVRWEFVELIGIEKYTGKDVLVKDETEYT